MFHVPQVGTSALKQDLPPAWWCTLQQILLQML